MTIVEVVDAHNGFHAITSRVKTTKLSSLLWLIGFVTFFLSAILDNLTTTIVMISLMQKLLERQTDRLFSPDFTDILTDRLRSGGFTVTSAASGDEAIAIITQFRPHVAALSLRSGHGHNLEPLSLIKGMDNDIEIILLTSKGTSLAGMQGIERGAFDCTRQPIELGVLIEKIRQAYAQRAARTSPNPPT